MNNVKSVGIIGLGRMGGNIAIHLAEQGIQIVAYNRTHQKAVEFAKVAGANATAVATYEELAAKLHSPRIVLLYLPSMQPTHDAIVEIAKYLTPGDTVVDCGNNHYKQALTHEKELSEKSIQFLDCGTSGGTEGARHGACLMIGGKSETFKNAEWLFKAIAMKDGYGYMGPAGAGHFVKMTHNGIEYAMLQAYADGFQLLHEGPYSANLNFAKISDVWNHGSVVRSWLLELAQAKFFSEPRLESILGSVGGGETGGWTVEQAHAQNTPVPSIELAVKFREESQSKPSFAGQVIAAIRNGFGAHEVKKK